MPRDALGDLIAFIAVARERSFTRAAAQLGVSHSALSHTIRELEARLGVRLLTRTTRSVSPTEAGERLLQTLAPRFAEIEAELAALSELREKPAGTIRITTGRLRSRRDPLAAAWQVAAAVSRHQGRDRRRLWADRHRRASASTSACAGRPGREGHDRGAHWAGHALRGRRCPTISRKRPPPRCRRS